MVDFFMSHSTSSNSNPFQLFSLWKVAIASLGIGVFIGFSLAGAFHALFYSGSLAQYALCLYILVVHLSFHFLEFFVESLYRSEDARLESFMFFHSIEYVIASSISFVEFFMKLIIFPSSKIYFYPLEVELTFSRCTFFATVTLCFYLIRVIAMAQCGSNFSLQIRDFKRSDHLLIKRGVYQMLRHPSYFGWFWRCFFSQLILGNMICCVAHTIITWFFFRKRIAYEEYLLESDEFFGREYTLYKKNTYIGIPFL